MFTGLVEAVGRIGSLEKRDGFTVVTIELPEEHSGFGTTLGESIAVNGCCLTLTHFTSHALKFDVSHESLKLTNLGNLSERQAVNLERALSLGDRLGGHMVSGHVDGLARLDTWDKREGGWDLYVVLTPDLGRYVIPKGSITLDGTSLTVNSVEDRPEGTRIRLTLIPSTLAKTSLAELPEGWLLNVEVDLIGKYVERLLSPRL